MGFLLGPLGFFLRALRQAVGLVAHHADGHLHHQVQPHHLVLGVAEQGAQQGDVPEQRHLLGVLALLLGDQAAQVDGLAVVPSQALLVRIGASMRVKSLSSK